MRMSIIKKENSMRMKWVKNENENNWKRTGCEWNK